MENFKITDTALFMLPMFGLPIKNYDEIGFINAYSKIEGIEDKVPCIYNVFFDAPIYENKLEDLIEMFSDLYVGKINYQNKLVIIVFKIPELLLPDYELILQGKYSKLSDKYKELVSDKPSRKGTNKDTRSFIQSQKKRLQLLIIEKDPKCREMVEKMYNGLDISFANEFWRMFDMERNTLTNNILEKLSKQKLEKKW